MKKVSIIIPTLNEEKFLPHTLKAIKDQVFDDYEIIVYDAGSNDETVKVAKKYGAKVVKGGKPGVGRNNGVKAAAGELLLFLDADVSFKKDFLEKSVYEFEKRKLGAATNYVHPISKHPFDILTHYFANVSLAIFQYFNPHAPGYCIWAKRKLHKQVGGFNTKLKLAEDHDYVKRIAKISKFRVLGKRKVEVSVRRYQKEGRIKLTLKYIYSEIYWLVFRKVDKEIVTYRFDHYNEGEEKKKK